MCVTFQPGPGRWCAGAGGQLPTGSPPPCPERDGARGTRDPRAFVLGLMGAVQR